MTKEFAVPFHWRRFRERYQLIGSKCEHCKKSFYPIRVICPHCRRAGHMKEIKFSGNGKVFSYTIIRAPPEGFKEYAPYIIAVVDLDEGTKILSQVVDCDHKDIKIGMKVKSCFRRIRSENDTGLVLYGFKFKPA